MLPWKLYRHNQYVLYQPKKVLCPRCGCSYMEFDKAFVDEDQYQKGQKIVAIPMHCRGCDCLFELQVKRGQPDDAQGVYLSVEVEIKK